MRVEFKKRQCCPVEYGSMVPVVLAKPYYRAYILFLFLALVRVLGERTGKIRTNWCI